MGHASRIGQAQAQPTVGDLEKARLTRQIEAEKLTEQTPIWAAVLGDRLAEWVRDGGPRPWDRPADDDSPQPHTYPPRRTR